MRNSNFEPDPVKVIGVVPAAGQATRLESIPRSKEVLEIAGRPVMEYIVERMRAANCNEIRVVTRPEKNDVAELAQRLGAPVRFGRPATIVESVLIATEDLEPQDLVLIGFPDTIWEPVDGFAQLIDLLKRGHDAALGLFLGFEPERSDVVVVDEPTGTVKEVWVKPVSPESN